jgi:glycerol-3-phosphate dehydrogenase
MHGSARAQGNGVRHSLFDVVVIGAGVVGSAIARYLSRYECTVAVVEREADVGMAASSHNSGVIHAGINYRPGSLRARLCMEGRRLLLEWCQELNVPYSTCGKLIVASCSSEVPELERLKRQGEGNGVPSLRIISPAKAAQLQPGIECVAALHVPTSGIVSPYALTIAMAEDAAVNGVRFFLEHAVTEIVPDQGGVTVFTAAADVRGRFVVNAAGIHAARIARTMDPGVPEQHACVGEYLILDKQAGEQIGMSVYPVPHVDSAGLGVHITPTTDQNVLLGPSSEYVDDPDAKCCTSATGDRLIDQAREMWPGLPEHLVIGAYAGVRPKLTPQGVAGFTDYVFRKTPEHPRVLHLIGIESPGLTAAPDIARYVVEGFLRPQLGLRPRPAHAVRLRRWPARFDGLPESRKRRLVREDPDSGEIICRCEGVTRRELLNALANPLGVMTLSGIKFRCRATMGRCGGGYCLPRIVAMLQEEFGLKPEAIHLRGSSSPAFAGRLLEEDHVGTSA